MSTPRVAALYRYAGLGASLVRYSCPVKDFHFLLLPISRRTSERRGKGSTQGRASRSYLYFSMFNPITTRSHLLKLKIFAIALHLCCIAFKATRGRPIWFHLLHIAQKFGLYRSPDRATRARETFSSRMRQSYTAVFPKYKHQSSWFSWLRYVYLSTRDQGTVRSIPRRGDRRRYSASRMIRC